MNVSVEWWRQKPDFSQFNKKMRGEELESMSTTDCVEFCCKGKQRNGRVTRVKSP